MATQEARDAAMAAYEAVVTSAPAEAAPAPAKPEGRDEKGRFEAKTVTIEPVHPVSQEEPAEDTKPDKPSKGKTDKTKAVPVEPKEETETEEEEKPAKPGVKDLSKEDLRKLNYGFEKLARTKVELRNKEQAIAAKEAQLEQERKSIPQQLRANLTQALKSDPTATIKQLCAEAGISLTDLYANHLTPHMINGERESETERISKLERNLLQRDEEWKSKQAEQLRAAQDQTMSQAKASFTNVVTADEDAYPFITGMLEPGEIADAALAIVPDMQVELGRVPTDKEIAKRLDESLRARYVKSERLKALAFGNSAPSGDAERGDGAVKSASPGKTRTLSNGLAAKPSATPDHMTRDQRREAALKLWPTH